MVFTRNIYSLNSEVQSGNIYRQIIYTLIVSIGSLSYGIQSGWISPMQKLLQSDSSPMGRPLTDKEVSWVATSTTTGGFFSGILHIYSADKFGRKIALLLVFIPQALCWVLLLVSSSYAALIVSRVCAGIGGAGFFIIAPMYTREICQDNLRGTMVTLVAVKQYGGILLAYLLGSYLDYYTVVWICLCFPAVAILSFMLFAPETPPFLVKMGKVEEATKTLAALRGLDVTDKTVQDEIDFIKSQHLYFKTIPRLTYCKILKNKAWRRGFIIGATLISCMNFNGVFSIYSYAHSIMAQSGVDVNRVLLTLSVPILMVFGSIVPLTCVDRIGRRPILILSYLMCALGEAVLSSSLLLTKYGVEFPGVLPVLSTAVTVFAYSMGVVPIPFIIFTEFFKFEIRAKLSGCIMILAWFLISCQLQFDNYMKSVIGSYGVYYIFAGVNLFTAVFVLVCVPETKAKTTEQIEDILGKRIGTLS